MNVAHYHLSTRYIIVILILDMWNIYEKRHFSRRVNGVMDERFT